MAAPADLPNLRSCRLLRRLTQPPRDGALPRHRAPDHPLARVRRGLELVLPRRRRIYPRPPSWHGAHPSLAAPELADAAHSTSAPQRAYRRLVTAHSAVRIKELATGACGAL